MDTRQKRMQTAKATVSIYRIIIKNKINILISYIILFVKTESTDTNGFLFIDNNLFFFYLFIYVYVIAKCIS